MLIISLTFIFSGEHHSSLSKNKKLSQALDKSVETKSVILTLPAGMLGMEISMLYGSSFVLTLRSKASVFRLVIPNFRANLPMISLLGLFGFFRQT